MNILFINSSSGSDFKELHSIFYFFVILAYTIFTFINKPFNEQIVNHYHFTMLAYLSILSFLSFLEWLIGFILGD